MTLTAERVDELIAEYRLILEHFEKSGMDQCANTTRDTLAALRAYREVVAMAASIELPALISELDRDAYSARAERYGSVRIGLANAFGVLAVLRTVRDPLTTAPTEAQPLKPAHEREPPHCPTCGCSLPPRRCACGRHEWKTGFVRIVDSKGGHHGKGVCHNEALQGHTGRIHEG